MYNGEIDYSSFSCRIGIAILVAMVVLLIYTLFLEIIIVTNDGIVFLRRKILSYESIESIEKLNPKQT